MPLSTIFQLYRGGNFNDRGENHRPVESHLQTLSLWKVSDCIPIDQVRCCSTDYWAEMILPWTNSRPAKVSTQ
jgi:hypothetical protein